MWGEHGSRQRLGPGHDKFAEALSSSRLPVGRKRSIPGSLSRSILGAARDTLPRRRIDVDVAHIPRGDDVRDPSATERDRSEGL
jgi:hypothetical protein